MNAVRSTKEAVAKSLTVLGRIRPVTYLMGAWLALTIGVGLVARLDYIGDYGRTGGWNNIVLANGNAAHHILDGDGFKTGLSREVNLAAGASATILPLSEVLSYEAPALSTPAPYLLPGYSYVTAAVWKMSGTESYGTAQAAQAIFDSVVGTSSAFLILALARLRVAAVLAAFGYAVSPLLIKNAALLMPESYSVALVLLALAVASFGLHIRRPMAGAFVAGFILGAAGWMRGESLAIVPLLMLVLFVTLRASLRTGVLTSSLVLLGWLLPSAALGAWYLDQYDEYHFSRPGAGIRVWAAISETQPNPWNIALLPEDAPMNDCKCIDAAAGALVRAHGYSYGTWEADSFLMSESLNHMLEKPTWFIKPMFDRLQRVLKVDGCIAYCNRYEGPSIDLDVRPCLVTCLNLHLPPDAFGGSDMSTTPILVAALGLAGLLLRNPLAGGLLLAAVVSKVLPFTLMLFYQRDIVLLAAAYVILLAAMADHLVATASWMATKAWPVVRVKAAAIASQWSEPAGGTAS
jgi:hypothetical protein